MLALVLLALSCGGGMADRDSKDTGTAAVNEAGVFASGDKRSSSKQCNRLAGAKPLATIRLVFPGRRVLISRHD